MARYKENIKKSIICLYNINKESMNCFSDNYKAFITASANKIPTIKTNERDERLLHIHILSPYYYIIIYYNILYYLQ